MMSVPHEALAYGWIPFVVVLLVIVVFSFVCIHYHKHKDDKNIFMTLMAIFGVAVALATCALVPVDVFLVSVMKEPDGQFKPWANDHSVKESIKEGSISAYYVFYGLSVAFLFGLLPFGFFYCKDAGNNCTFKTRLCNGLIFSSIFVLVGIGLFVIGVLVPIAGKPSNGTSAWDEIRNFNNSETTYAENGLLFTVHFLMLFGMLPLILYLGSGLAIGPMSFMHGKNQRDEVSADSLQSQSMQEPHERQSLISRQNDGTDNRWSRYLRHLAILFGIVLLAVSCLVFVSLLLTDIEKLLNSLGPLTGYYLPDPRLPNPIDMLLVYAHQVYPLDLLIILLLIFFLVFCAMSSMKVIGFGRCWKLAVRKRNTRPQSLLMLSFLLMLILLAMNVLIYEMVPQYAIFGSQKYIMNETTSEGHVTQTVLSCTMKAPKDECIMTGMGVLLLRFINKFWLVGAVYYWASWIFLAVFPVAFVVSAIMLVITCKQNAQLTNAVGEQYGTMMA